MALLIDPHELHRYSLEEYHRLIESGGFDEDSRVELINGLLVSMSPKTREHELAVRFLTEWLFRELDLDLYTVGIGSPLTLRESEPEPDVAVFGRDVPRPYHPSTATLVIEVAVSSHRRDLVTKPEVYAEAGISEYWVCDLPGRRIVCHTDPGEDGYVTRRTVGEGEQLVPTGLRVAPLDVSALLRAADA